MKKYAAVFGLICVWGAYYMAIGEINQTLSPQTTGFLVKLGVGIPLLVTILLTQGGRALLQVGPYLPRLLLIGTMGFTLDFTAFLGFAHLSAAAGGALLKTDVLFVNLLTVLLYRQRLAPASWLFSLLMLLGVLVMSGASLSALTASPYALLFLASALCIAINAFLVGGIQRDPRPIPRPSNLVIAFYNNCVALTLFTLTLLFTGGLPQAFTALRSPLAPLLAVAFLGQYGVYLLYYKSLGEHPIWLVKSLLLLIPVVSLVLGALFLGARPTPRELLGMAILLTGAAGILLTGRQAT